MRSCAVFAAKTAGTAVCGALLLLLSACSVLPEADPQQVYTLPAARTEPAAASTATTAAAATRGSLRVLTPYSNRMVAGTRILVRPDEGELSVYKGARWSDSGPVVIRDRLVDAFRADGRFSAVSNDSVHLEADLALGGDLNSFEVEYVNGAPVVHIQLDAFLVEPLASRIIASKRFRVVQAVDGKEVPEVVNAFGEGADILAAEIVAWAAQQRTRPLK